MFAHEDNKNLYHMLLVHTEIISKLESKEDKTEEDIADIQKQQEDFDRVMHQLLNSLNNQMRGQDHGMVEQVVINENGHFDRGFKDVPGFTSDRVRHYRKKDLEVCEHVLVRDKDNSWTCINCFNHFHLLDNKYSSLRVGLSYFAPAIEPTKKMKCAFLNLPAYYENENSYVDGISDITDYSFKYLKAAHELKTNYTPIQVATKISSYIDADEKLKRKLEFQIIKYKLGIK